MVTPIEDRIYWIRYGDVKRPVGWLALLIAELCLLSFDSTAPSALDEPAFNFDGTIYGDHAVEGLYPDPRVKWHEFRVEGLGLRFGDTALVLPHGSILSIPVSTADSSYLQRSS